MNGIHRFLVATVLSVQDSSFTYAACHNCFSRVICSASRYECPRCGYTSKEPIHRYKVSLKVADGRQLYIITVFGGCLDKVFGTSAPAFLGRLQDVMKMPSELRSDGGRELLFQALQYCFLGRSFLFGVKVPAGDRDSSRRLSFQGSLQHLIAVHVSLPNRDSVGCTVLQRFEELLQSFLSSQHTPDRTLSPTGKTSQIPDVSWLSRSLGDGCAEEGQQAVDWWQKSLGLSLSSSSRLSNSPADASLHEVIKSSEWVSFDKGPNSNATSRSGPDHVKSGIFCIPSTSTPKPGDARQQGNNTMTASQPPGDVTGYGSFFSLKDPPDGPSNSKTAHEREIHRLSTWRYADRTCQGHVSPSKNAATAGTHQTAAEDWEDFLFSESLSELITKAEKEDADAQRSSKTHKRAPNTGANLKSPRDQAFPCQWNAASGRDMATEANTLLCLPDGYTSTSQKSDPLPSQPRCFQAEETSVLAQASENLSTPPLKPEDTLGSPPALGVSQGSRENLLTQPFGHELNENRCVRGDGGGIVFPFRQSINCPEIRLSCQGETTELKESGFREGLLQTHFNTSADLFETSGSLSVTAVEEAPTLCNISTVVDYTAKDEPCSPGSIVPATEDLSQTHDFASGFHSTPALKQIPRPRPLRLNKNLLNVSMSGTGGLLSSRRTSCQSMRNDLLKKMACSFLEGHTASSRAINMSSSGSSDLARFVFHPGSSERTSSFSQVVKLETRRAGLSGQGSPMDLIDGENSCGQLGFGHEIKTDSESNSSNPVSRDQTDGFINELLGLSPVPLAATSETNSFPNDWSPELFAEKSNIYHQNESLQRRLF